MSRKPPGLTIKLPSLGVLDLDEDPLIYQEKDDFIPTKEKIHKFFNNMSHNFQSAVPTNIHSVIDDLTFFPSQVKGNFNKEYGQNKPEEFLTVKFDRRTQIAYTDRKFTKRSIINTNQTHNILMHAICSFVMEIAMQKYAYTELRNRTELRKNQLGKIRIPKIFSYGIEPDNNCVVTMQRMPQEYETLYQFLNPAKQSQSLQNRSNTTAKRPQSLQNRSNITVKRPYLLQNRNTTSKWLQRNSANIRFNKAMGLNRREIFKRIAKQLSLIFNSIEVMHNDANLNNIYINDKFEVFVIDFGRAEMGLKDRPILYPRTHNSIPTFHSYKPDDTYYENINAFIESNTPGGNIKDMQLVVGPRLGGNNTLKRNG